MDQYTQSAILTASPEKLVQMLYEKSIDLIKKAISKMDEIEVRNSSLVRAEEIVLYLNSVLDMDKGGTISKNLRALYDFIYRQLIDGNVNGDVKKLEFAQSLLQEMLDVWKETSKRTSAPRPSKTGFSVSV